jgi:hypothetical protein
VHREHLVPIGSAALEDRVKDAPLLGAERCVACDVVQTYFTDIASFLEEGPQGLELSAM